MGVPCRGKNPGQNVHFIDFLKNSGQWISNQATRQSGKSGHARLPGCIHQCIHGPNRSSRAIRQTGRSSQSTSRASRAIRQKFQQGNPLNQTARLPGWVLLPLVKHGWHLVVVSTCGNCLLHPIGDVARLVNIVALCSIGDVARLLPIDSCARLHPIHTFVRLP